MEENDFPFSKVLLKTKYNAYTVFYETFAECKDFGFNIVMNNLSHIIFYQFNSCPNIFFIVLRTSKNCFKIYTSEGEVYTFSIVKEVIDFVLHLAEWYSNNYDFYLNFNFTK